MTIQRDSGMRPDCLRLYCPSCKAKLNPRKGSPFESLKGSFADLFVLVIECLITKHQKTDLAEKEGTTRQKLYRLEKMIQIVCQKHLHLHPAKFCHPVQADEHKVGRDSQWKQIGRRPTADAFWCHVIGNPDEGYSLNFTEPRTKEVLAMLILSQLKKGADAKYICMALIF